MDGQTVDFVVRWERGTIDRFIYSLAMLSPASQDVDHPDLTAWNGVLLDNMPTDQMREAVALRDRSGRRLFLEASGNISLERARAVAETGVDFLSVGALTHSAPSTDLSLRMD